MKEETKRFIELAKDNRRRFLEPYRLEFQSTDDQGKRAAIIIELLKLEPSHLDEPWISHEIIKWMRDIKCVDYLDQTFIVQADRDRPTDQERIKDAKDFFLRDKIRQIREDECIKTDPAFKILADDQLNNPNNLYPGLNSQDGGYKTIQKRYYESGKKRKSIDSLPYPYFGYDVRERKGKFTFYWNGMMQANIVVDGKTIPCRGPGGIEADIDCLPSLPNKRPQF